MLSFSWRRFFQAKCVGGEWFLLKMERTAGFAGDETQPKKREARHCDNVSSIFQKLLELYGTSWPQGVRPKQPRGYGFSPKKRAAAAAAGDSLEM